MPKEILHSESTSSGPPEVYVTLRDLIGLQHQAHGFSFLPRFAVQSILAGRHRSRLRGRGLDFDEVRKYVAGDDIRNIHWKVTARVGATHTKVFTEERERPVLLIVDQSSSMFFGSVKYLKSVIAAHIGALGTWRVLDVGDRIGGVVFNDFEMEYVPPKRNRKTVQHLLSVIARFNQSLKPVVSGENEKMLNQVLSYVNQVVTHDYLLVVVSDFQDANDHTFRQFIQMGRHNNIIAAQVIDPMEQHLPDNRLVISDGEHQTLVDGRRKLSSQFKKIQSNRKNWLIEKFRKYGIPIMSFNTKETASNQLRQIIGKQVKNRTK